MDSNGDKKRARSLVVAGSGWLWLAASFIVSLTKFVAEFTKLVTTLEIQHKNFATPYIVTFLHWAQYIPWRGVVFMVVCGALFAMTPFWLWIARWIRCKLKKHETLEKIEALEVDLEYRAKFLEYLEKIELSEKQKKKLREMGIDVPGEPDTNEKKAADFLNSQFADPDQRHTRTRFRRYMELVKNARRMLRMTPEEARLRLLRAGVDIPLRYVEFLLNNPDFILHQKYWPAWCDALYEPERYIQNGRSFVGNIEWAILRLIRYHELKRIEIFMYAPELKGDLSALPDVGPERIQQILDEAEAEISEIENKRRSL